MIKKPAWILDLLADKGQDLLDDKATVGDCSEEIAGKILANDHPLATEIIVEKAKSWLKQWMYEQVRHAMEDRESGQERLEVPFRELSPYLEVAPGRLVHQNKMNGKDWDNALAIYRNRAEQADTSLSILQRIYDRIRPLLTDEVLTTADVVDML